MENMETAKKVIEVTVRDRVATHIGDDFYVCGNTEYEIHFDFDEEWDALDIKTARFIADGNVLYPDRIFSGNVCSFPDNPPISNTTSVRVGVFAGNLHTTTPARIPAVKSILCGTSTPAAPDEDAYHEAMEEMAKVATEARAQAEASAQSAQASARSAQSAAEVTVVASECAQAAEAAKTSAEQYSANADAQANAAATSAQSAAESASESVAARDKAIAQADDAEESAKVASDAAQAARDSSAGVAAAEAAAAKSAETAAEYVVAASECAKAAETAETTAERYSANADVQARAAAQSANAAAQSANAAAASASESVAARDKAIAQADDAEESAKAAAKSAQSAAEVTVAASECAKAAEDAERAAERYSANADTQALAAAKSAQSAAESVQDLFIVKVTGATTSHNQSEIKAAVAANKTCLLVDSDGRVFSYFSEHYDQDYGYCPAFHAPLTYKFGTGILYAEKFVTPDGRVIEATYTPAQTPNPFKLKLTGAVEAEYNGSAAVTVQIPAGGGAGLPETADPLKQLVTDADGKVAWEDRLAYKQTVQAVNLEATELQGMDDDGDGTNEGFLLLSPWAVDLVAGGVATVTCNGTAYECAVIDYSQFESGVPAGTVVMGNLDAMGATGIEGSNTDAPFLMMAVPNASAVDMGGMYGMFMPFDGATSVTIAVSSVGDIYKTIDPGYLPKQKQAELTFTGYNGATYDGSMPVNIEIPTALPNPQKLTFSGAVATSYNGQSAVTVKLPTALPNPNALTFTGATSATYNGNSALTVDIPKVPKPTTSDAGKFLRVNTSGAYALEAIANAEEATF